MSEIKAQAKAFTNLWNSRPDLRGRVFAINNNSVNGIKGAMNKAMGVVPGVADMCFMKPEGRTCWIEWKTDTGKQSPHQVNFQRLCLSLGHEYHIVRSEEEFLKVINS
jgi:2-succinyl-5-enolpyruvyl-6-hydroxy-3-cyclohexene-1-carboxylate synthase